ncbi:MAG TPA: TRAP transporter small permease subunit [Burkholderiales bacterium]|nr:TRAP transporter small permease subunit [Burkholderiales bacterium]
MVDQHGLFGSALRNISARLNTIALLVCVACVLSMLSISFIGFFYMLVTGEALSWTYSLARLFIPWIGMLSITVAFHGGEHVAMNLLSRLLPAQLAVILRYASLAAVAVFAVLLLWFGWQFFSTTTQYYMVSDQIQIHGRWVAACVPVSGAIMLVHLVNGTAILESQDVDSQGFATHESGPG